MTTSWWKTQQSARRYAPQAREAQESTQGEASFSGGQEMQLTAQQQEYWRRNLNLTLVLLVIWFVSTFVMGYFARELNEITIPFFRFPLSFYMAAQGSLIIYIVIIWYYARKMGQLDEEYGVAEGEK
jgi:putative solute:sodium symporter small subunit